MNLQEAKGTWDDQKKRFRKKFTSLTQSDFIFISGEKHLMLDKLRIKLGKTTEEMDWLLLTV